MNTEMQKRALAVREAHIALLDLKRVVDEAAQTAHAVELEADHLAIRPRTAGEIFTRVRRVLERLRSNDFEGALNRARRSLQTAMS
jgi:hypothetical protein